MHEKTRLVYLPTFLTIYCAPLPSSSSRSSPGRRGVVPGATGGRRSCTCWFTRALFSLAFSKASRTWRCLYSPILLSIFHAPPLLNSSVNLASERACEPSVNDSRYAVRRFRPGVHSRDRVCGIDKMG